MDDQKRFTIEEIKNYLIKSDSFGDAIYFLSEEAIIKANTKEDIDYGDDLIEDYFEYGVEFE